MELASQLGAQMSCTAVHETSQLERIGGRVSGARQQAWSLTERLENILERLRGCPPKAGEKCAPTPIRSGLLGEIEDQLDGVASASERLESQIEELNRLV